MTSFWYFWLQLAHDRAAALDRRAFFDSFRQLSQNSQTFLPAFYNATITSRLATDDFRQQSDFCLASHRSYNNTNTMAGVVWLPPRLLVASSRAAVAHSVQRASILSVQQRCAVPILSPLTTFPRPFSSKPPPEKPDKNNNDDGEKEATRLNNDEQQSRARELQAKRPWHREDADRPPADKPETPLGKGNRPRPCYRKTCDFMFASLTA